MPRLTLSPFPLKLRLARWWGKQSPARQDRYAMLAPVVAVMLFMMALTAAFLYLRYEELDREQEAVRRDTEYSQQHMRLRLLEQQEGLLRVARDLANRELDRQAFLHAAEKWVTETPEIFELTWLDNQRKVIASFSDASAPMQLVYYTGESLTPTQIGEAFDQARTSRHLVYSKPQLNEGLTDAVVQLHIPLLGSSGLSGVLVSQYSVDALLRYTAPSELTPRYAIALLNEHDAVIAGNTRPGKSLTPKLLPWSDPENHYTVPLSPLGNGMLLRMQAYRTSQGVVGTAVYWLVAVLSFMTAWMLIGTFRHTRRRIQAQEALIKETNFRRAMENSMVTGMRAMDMDGRITYVNPAFSQMTGWSEDELVGQSAPFPYWPEDDMETLTNRLTEELNGRTVPGGFEMRVKRKNDSIFDARMYVSPLIDPYGVQTGWMTSMTDITEPKRVREELSASYERFTTVLEGLDAAVSVAPLGSDELLFANQLYREWFDDLERSHHTLIELAGLSSAPPESADTSVDNMAGMPTDAILTASQDSTDSAEVYVPELHRWMEVRSRYLNWVDGSLVQILIASDITARRHAEEMAQTQTERAQSASRLITMGEMASSVAHELNQPLTAINNYCTGLISRIKARNLSENDLLGALDKTARQAQRAGQIIQRIRNFVKKSEPNRAWSEVSLLVAEAVELAEIELRRRNVRLSRQLAPRMPKIWVDPILIEQVLINLIKNAAESVDMANRPFHQRTVECKVHPTTVDGAPMIEFSVQDWGQGISDEVMSRLYEAFFSTKSEGMGIGLSLCRSIIESHQGRMQAENIYNGEHIVGCRFTFWVPVAKTSDPQDRATGDSG
jgi:PAS domain S-box-containing protein